MANPLDDKLKELSQIDWDTFVAMIGEESITTAKIRLLRKEGKSYRQICLKVGVTMSKARSACKNEQSCQIKTA